MIGFTLGALGLATSWKVAETTVATLVLPLLVLAIRSSTPASSR